MIPIPQYPLYSATLDEFGLGQVMWLSLILASLGYQLFVSLEENSSFKAVRRIRNSINTLKCFRWGTSWMKTKTGDWTLTSVRGHWKNPRTSMTHGVFVLSTLETQLVCAAISAHFISKSLIQSCPSNIPRCPSNHSRPFSHSNTTFPARAAVLGGRGKGYKSHTTAFATNFFARICPPMAWSEITNAQRQTRRE